MTDRGRQHDGARVLVIDDDRSMCELVQVSLAKRGHRVEWRNRGDEGLQLLQEQDVDVVLVDVRLKDESGLAVCERVVANWPDTPVIVITAFGSMETAVAAIRVGAYDFITKPIDMGLLGHAIHRAVQHRDLREEVRRLRRTVDRRAGEQLVGDSPAIQEVCDLVARVNESDSTVLISGESGTGKELVARAIHETSERRGGPFVAVNCAAMPQTLLESELFGHVRGAFTDAKRSRDGLFVQASKGTLLLDEIGEMPLEMQPTLLRALEERTVRPIGGVGEVPFDTRIIAATNRDLESDVEAGRFREDLFYRINVVPIHIPPLRSRGNDILLLAQYFLELNRERTGKQVVGFASAAAQRLLDYDWPGNVRELQNCVERALTLTRFDTIIVEDLPEKIRSYRSSRLVIFGDDPEQLLSLEEVERRYINRVLDALGGNKTQAARILGLDRRTLYRKLERYEKV